jgi:hypothetical protein
MFFSITDQTATESYDALDIGSPTNEKPVANTTTVTTIDNNVSTYFTALKREWKVDFPLLSQDEYAAIKDFRDRQFTNFKYPAITIPILGMDSVTAFMTLNDTSITNECGLVEGLSATFRESKQI